MYLLKTNHFPFLLFLLEGGRRATRYTLFLCNPEIELPKIPISLLTLTGTKASPEPSHHQVFILYLLAHTPVTRGFCTDIPFDWITLVNCQNWGFKLKRHKMPWLFPDSRKLLATGACKDSEGEEGFLNLFWRFYLCLLHRRSNAWLGVWFLKSPGRGIGFSYPFIPVKSLVVASARKTGVEFATLFLWPGVLLWGCVKSYFPPWSSVPLLTAPPCGHRVWEVLSVTHRPELVLE